MKRHWPLFLAAGLVSAVIIVLAVWAGARMADVELRLHGMVAIGLGATLSLALSAGLFFLVFHSSRKGYDDDAHGGS